MPALKYFRRGGIVYGTCYTARQGFAYIQRSFASIIHSQSFASCGADFRCGVGVFIDYPRNIRVGHRCLIDNGVAIGAELPQGSLIIGDDVQINRNCSIDFSGTLTIGNGTLISAESTILTHDHGLDPRSTPEGASLEIGDFVWIGARSIILHSVSQIGARSVIAAGSVVTKDVPSDTVVAGNPARPIRRKT
ncbi:acyltransferase [Posidoniimonas corsicana]|uniref:acyltransferase n=1 Tax=Posidoniimonas corsicana TaxID=1938618 RepID=UPI0011B3C954|nr:acyltransferase [Posidoniimonas corsicana]